VGVHGFTEYLQIASSGTRETVPRPYVVKGGCSFVKMLQNRAFNCGRERGR
jgi:hypothetical protein